MIGVWCLLFLAKINSWCPQVWIHKNWIYLAPFNIHFKTNWKKLSTLGTLQYGSQNVQGPNCFLGLDAHLPTWCHIRIKSADVFRIPSVRTKISTNADNWPILKPLYLYTFVYCILVFVDHTAENTVHLCATKFSTWAPAKPISVAIFSASAGLTPGNENVPTKHHHRFKF